MTHPNSIAIDAVNTYVFSIKFSLKNNALPINELRTKIYSYALTIPKTSLIKHFIVSASQRPNPVELENGKSVNTDKYIGYLGHALQNSFYELLYGNSFYSSIVNICKRGGDTDTNCCIAGALLGSLYGSKNIPYLWKYTVKNSNNKRRLEQYDEIKQNKLEVIARRLLSLKNNINN